MVEQGVASAVNDTSREFGSALGIAILGTILNARYRSGVHGALTGLPAVVGERAQASIAFVKIGGSRLAALGEPGRHLIATAKASFVAATGTAFTVAAAFSLAGALIVFFAAPRYGGTSPASEVVQGRP